MTPDMRKLEKPVEAGRSAAASALLVGALGIPLGPTLHGVDALGTDFAGIGNREVWLAAVTTSVGPATSLGRRNLARHLGPRSV